MADSSIQWTDKVWNPMVGCSIHTPGCRHCYAMKLAHRLSRMGQDKYAGLTEQAKGGAVWNGRVRVDRRSLGLPLTWKKPRKIFVNSMSDLFHEDFTDEDIDEVFAVMAIAHWHTFQPLTKREGHLLEYLSKAGRLDDIYDHWTTFSGSSRCAQAWPLPNVHIGLSVEDQQRANQRSLVAKELAEMGWLVWLSIEPLLEGIDIRIALPRHAGDKGVRWVVVGGESGPGARPFNLSWARDIIRQCRERGARVFVKQLGAEAYDDISYVGASPRFQTKDRAGGDPAEWPEDLRVREFPA